MRFKCENCDFSGQESKFKPAERLGERLDPGGVYTDRECPECGALAYPHTKYVVRNKDTNEEVEVKASGSRDAAYQALDQLRWVVMPSQQNEEHEEDEG